MLFFVVWTIIIPGLCIDLFDEIAKKLEFEYELYESSDGYFGALKDDGTWNGAIHELIAKVTWLKDDLIFD